MAILYNEGTTLAERVDACLDDEFAHKAVERAQDVFYDKRNAVVDELPNWDDMRHAARAIRNRVNKNLDYYVAEFARNAQAAGAHVHFAPTAEDALCEILDVFEEAHASTCVKSKSMMSEEIGMNEVLEEAGMEVVETDCAEAILQTAKDHPSHIVVPALHLDHEAIARMFHDELGYAGSSVPEDITRFLRVHLREKFLAAEVGVRGCNFAVASTGSTTLVTNEGNGRMVDTLPATQIVLVGIDRIVPDLESLDLMTSLLVRSAVGSKLTAYFTVDCGPAADDEGDGARDVHIIMIDNGRSDILGTEFAAIERCIRCGACLNICPVYRHITGHGYGSIYPGPMGIVMTCCLEGYDKVDKLPYACSLCSACTSNCPMDIPLHDLIRQHRVNMVAQGYAGPIERRAFETAGHVLSSRPLYDVATKVAARGMKPFARNGQSLGPATAWIPVLGAWTRNRDFNRLADERFRDWFKKHEKEQGNAPEKGEDAR